jgi:hypothetical protein
VKLHAALIAAVVAVAATTGASNARTAALSLTLSEFSPYAYHSGTTLFYSLHAFAFTVKASGGSTPYTFDDVPGLTKTVSGSGSTATYDGAPTASTSGNFDVTDGASTVQFTLKLDTIPTVLSTAPVAVTGADNQYWSSSIHTLWFRPAGAGSFTLNATADDGPGSGIAQVEFPDISTISGWAGSAGGIDPESSYASPVAYAWTAGAVAPGLKDVVATTNTGVTGSAPIAINADSTAPSGQSVVLSGGSWYTSPSVALTIGTGTDPGAGVDSSRGIVERASAPLANSVCGAFGTFAAVTLSSGTDTSVSSGNCYRYQYKAIDNVGNVSAASTASADAKVDTTPPTTPNLVFSTLTNVAAAGNVLYYRPGGSGRFTVTAASGDAESGIASYSFPSITGFTMVGSGPTRVFSFTAAPSWAPPAVSVTATNGAGLASPGATLALAPDATPPTVSVRCNSRPCLTTTYPKAVAVTMSATDGAGSGVDTIRFTTNGTAPTLHRGFEYSRQFTLRSFAHLRVRAYDRAGNASNAVNVTIRSAADKLVFASPARLAVKAGARFAFAKVTSSRRGVASVALTGPGLKTPRRWRFVLESGASVVQLRLPATLARKSRYKLVWTIRAGTQTTSTTTLLVVL